MYNASNDDKIVQCPYNKYHTMPSSSLQRHLVKCEKNYGENYKVMCPYNATHRLSKSEIAEHIETCSARKIVEANYIDQRCIATSTKQKNESSFGTAVEDEWEKQMGASSRFTPSKHIYVNQNDESEIDDAESLISSMGIGRGRIPMRDNAPIKLRFL